jgi:outer membrane protein assembly factor BamB
MLEMKPFRFAALSFIAAACFAGIAHAQKLDPAQMADLHSGLIVQLGASDTDAASELSQTGRYLIHVLDRDAQLVEKAQESLRKTGRYGLAWAEQHDAERLPYAENMVNQIVVRDFSVPLEEIARVLTPGGSLVIANSERIAKSQLEAAGFESIVERGSSLIARKAWPQAMDIWSHPRHAANGNAVSSDTLVGPPKRVRWVAAATSEVEGMVTSGGRNFYGGVLARDSFNGLRLWHRNLRNADQHNQAQFELPKLPRDAARPIASERFLIAVLADKPVALDAKTGEVVVEFVDLANPTAIIHHGARVIAADADSIRAFNLDTGKTTWKVAATNPRNVIADDKLVTFIQGNARRGGKPQAVALDANSGQVRWQRDDYAWLERTVRTVLAEGQLVFEVSTLNDNDDDCGIHVVSAETGEHRWSKNFAPGMNHRRQARAMFVGGDLWILHGGKVNTADPQNRTREAVRVSALDPKTGSVRVTYPAGLAHCFPPVATPNFMFAGELDLTNLKSGEVVANRITKANCSLENGWVPANGLVYTTPKHCTCWPMLRGFVAMAPESKEKSAADLPLDQIEFLHEQGPAKADPQAAASTAGDWPLYRNDRWRSGSTVAAGPLQLNERWRAALTPVRKAESESPGAILHDWLDNPVVKGPLTAPTLAGGLAYVARPHEHEVVAIDVETGEPRWRFTANGRVDTPPAVHRGLCLFGSAAGWVYALRADTGRVVWRLRAAPTEERIVAYGQVESPWPAPGAVLVMDDVAYFAAGRQPLADGGILVFAVDPMTGDRHWVQRVDTVPQKGFYENSGLEFDPFDILHAEGDGLAMSRWVLSRDGEQVSVDKWNAFAKLNTGAGEVWVPRGSWTYGARHQHRFAGEAPRRPLVVFRDDNVYSSLNGTTSVFRRDFNLEAGEKFDSKWITGWKAGQLARQNGKPYRTYRIAEGAAWTNDPFADPTVKPAEPKQGQQLHNEIHAMALDGEGKLYVVHQDGRLKVMATETGEVLAESQVPPPAWDGLAIAQGRLFLSTQSGELICLGE